MKMRKFLFSIVLLFSVNIASAQEVDSVDLSTPYKSIWTHLYYLQPDTYNDSLAAQPFEPHRRGLKTSKQLAIKLKQVLDGNGIFIYMDEVPRQPNYYDSTANKQKFVLSDQYADIYLLKRDNGNWVFADASATAINEAHDETYRYGTGT